MSHKIRIRKLEKEGVGDKLWALIGIGRPRDSHHQQLLEMQARSSFYASGGDRDAYLTFLPFEDFNSGFIGYVKKSELMLRGMNKTKNPAER